MSDFQRVLDTAEQHLLALKAAGVRFLTVQPETLSQLREPPPRSVPVASKWKPEPEQPGATSQAAKATRDGGIAAAGARLA